MVVILKLTPFPEQIQQILSYCTPLLCSMLGQYHQLEKFAGHYMAITLANLIIFS